MIGRYWHTLRHLRAIQIYGRLHFRLTTPAIAPAATPPLRKQSGAWQVGARRGPSLIGPREFSLLNVSGSLVQCGWDGPTRDRLWRYNQHYFDDLNAVDGATRREWQVALLQDWIEHNPPGRGVGWEPYPTSRRIVNWIKWMLAGNELSEACRENLAIQTRWLNKRLEWHLLGNHLLANAKALVFSGLWFDGQEAHQWLDQGLDILAREVQEQILPDGGHFELSPMYHALALEDLLDLINVAHAYSDTLSSKQHRDVDNWKSRIPPMIRWYYSMCHPDGEIAFFNDSAFGAAPTPQELGAYAARLGFGAEHEAARLIWLADSGYARLSQPRAVLFADMARVGPNYLPGHAHADTLSFEFSLDGQRFFVNSGTSVYGLSAERHRQRSTAAHNTVVVEDRNSSDVWSSFRVGRRAHPRNARLIEEGDVLIAEASHDGYRNLSGRPLHNRCWRLYPNQLTVEDRITAPVRSAEARYHLHPDVQIEQGAPNAGICRLPGGQIALWKAERGLVRLEPATWHPEFGNSLSTNCLVISLSDGRAQFTLNWS